MENMITIYLYIDKDGWVEGWGSTPSENTFEIVVENNHPVLTKYSFYRIVNGELVEDVTKALKGVKESKEYELSKACEKAIVDGFTHEIRGDSYHFSLDVEAQLNFLGASVVKTLLEQNILDNVRWTAREGGIDGSYTRVELNENEILELYVEAFKHKYSQIAKFRDVLLPLVNQATTIEEVKSITWEYEPDTEPESENEE